jgi:hypothetical protein
MCVYLTPEELAERLADPRYCVYCFAVAAEGDRVKNHVCESCGEDLFSDDEEDL